MYFPRFKKHKAYPFSSQYTSSITNQGNKQKTKPKDKLLFKQLFLKRLEQNKIPDLQSY